MPQLLHIIGALVLTYWCSRAALRFLGTRGTVAQRTIAAHILSLVFLSLIVGWFERSPTAFLPYLPAQLFWLIVDKVSQQPNLMKTRKSRRRSQRTEGANPIARGVKMIVSVVTAAFLAVGIGIFADEAYGYANVYLIDPGQGFRNAVRTDVVYALGKPDLTRADSQSSFQAGGPDSNNEWLYKGTVMNVRFDPATGFVTSLSCQEDHALAKEGCPANLGVRIGTHEDDLYDALGAPTREQLLPDGRKIMRYQDIGHDYVLEQFYVKSIRLYPDNAGILAKLGRLMVWMLP